jgi:hypothetical protein
MWDVKELNSKVSLAHIFYEENIRLDLMQLMLKKRKTVKYVTNLHWNFSCNKKIK